MILDRFGRPFDSRARQCGFIIDPYRFATGGAPDPATRVLALDMEGSGATFVDNSSSPKTVTASGGATQTNAQAKFGSKSCELSSSTSDYLDVASSAAFSLTTFTISFWIRMASVPSGSGIYPCVDFGSYITGFSQRINQVGGDYYVYWNSASNSKDFTPVSWPATTWVHVALTRDSSDNLRMFFGGGLVGTAAGVTQVLSSPAVRIGYILAGGVSTKIQTWFDDFVIANTCWWDAAFTPPTASLAGP